MMRHDGQRLVEECPHGGVIDLRKTADVEISQALLGPCIGLAGVRMDRMRDELLAQPSTSSGARRMPGNGSAAR